MSRIFISYHRRSQAVASSLVQDLEAMGHTVWFDQELAGGQSWWDRILAMIREAEAFLLVLDTDSLDSVACKREYTYAHDLGKPIVPVLTGTDVSVNLLPPALSQIQLVDYRNHDRDGLLRLTRALTTLPPARPLPDPLPPAPAVPLSYLGTLTEQIEQTAALSYEAQSALLVDLRANARDVQTRADALTLLRRLRRRRDLFASIGDEIDELLRGGAADRGSVRATAGEPAAPAPEPDRAAPAVAPVGVVLEPLTKPPGTGGKDRLVMAGVAAVAGIVAIAAAVMAFATASTRSSEGALIVLMFGPLWAVAGAIAGKQALALKLAGALALVGVFVVWVFAIPDQEAGLIAFAFGAPAGLAIGALIGAVLCRRRRAQAASSPAHS